MIYWLDSFMALFGYKRPEVWEAERKEHDVTFPAPLACQQAFPDDMKPPPGCKFKELQKKSNVRSKRANVRSKRANVRSKRSQYAEGRHEPLTYIQIQGNGMLCHKVYVLWQSGGTDAEIAEVVGATIAAVRELRRRKRWIRNNDAKIDAKIARQLYNDKANVQSKKTKKARS